MELDKNAKGWLRFLNEMIICDIYFFFLLLPFFWQKRFFRTNMMILLLGVRVLEFEILALYATEKKIETNTKKF